MILILFDNLQLLGLLNDSLDSVISRLDILEFEVSEVLDSLGVNRLFLALSEKSELNFFNLINITK